MPVADRYKKTTGVKTAPETTVKTTAKPVEPEVKKTAAVAPAATPAVPIKVEPVKSVTPAAPAAETPPAVVEPVPLAAVPVAENPAAVPVITQQAAAPTESLADMLNRIYAASAEQSANTIDYGTQQGVDELTRSLQESQAAYRAQKNEANINEARALDNQALTSAIKGDRGGIGQAQYGSIQASANTTRGEINAAQQKLASDTDRQISQLRANGEYQKADALLEQTQAQLSQLMQLRQDEEAKALTAQKYADSQAQTKMSTYKALVDDAISGGASLADIPEEYITSAGYTPAMVKSMIDSQLQDTLYSRYSKSQTATEKAQKTAQERLQVYIGAGWKAAQINAVEPGLITSAGYTDSAVDAAASGNASKTDMGYYETLYQSASQYSDPKAALKNYLIGNDYTAEEASTIAKGYDNWKTLQGGELTTGLDNGTYSSFKQGIGQYLYAGNKTAAEALLNKYSSSLSAAQWAEIQKILDNYYS